MQIRNATHDGQLDLLDRRATMLGFDVYGIESDKMFVELQRRCFDCSFQEDCAIDLRRDLARALNSLAIVKSSRRE
jgi:hypothetical protein